MPNFPMVWKELNQYAQPSPKTAGDVIVYSKRT